MCSECARLGTTCPSCQKRIDTTKDRTFWIDGALYKIEPASCRCGGSWAWLKQLPSGAWEMVGCICHHLPNGWRFIGWTRAGAVPGEG